MLNKINLLLVGVGGQGTILASKILAEVALLSGLDVKMSEIHGMAQRGGSVVTHVKMGDEIYSPLVEEGEADIILSFEQLEALRWLSFLKSDGEIITGTQVIEPVPVIMGKAVYPSGIVETIQGRVQKLISLDALAVATECGNAKASNVVLMGVLARRLGFAKEIWLKALENKVPTKFLEINKIAFTQGYELV